MKRILTVLIMVLLVAFISAGALAQEQEHFFCESDLKCAEYNLPGISTCTNNPDNNPLTWDYTNQAISSCIDYICTIPTYSFIHTCDMSRCGAECVSNTNCPKKCVGNVYYSAGSCVACSCSYSQEDCDLLDGWYELGLSWVDIDQCTEKEQIGQEYRDYSCGQGGCLYLVTDSQQEDTGLVRNKPDFTVCDDGLWCTVEDNCQIGACVAQPRDCSANDIFGVSTCDSNLDNNLLTFDFREAFTSTCNEEQDLCTEGSELISSTCDKERCGAECETNADCINRCEENIFYSSGLCQEGCACSYASQDCDLLDGWYSTSLTQWIDIDQCYEKQQQDEEYRDYTCSVGGCEYVITSNRWVDTGSERGKPDFTACDDELWCTIEDSCQMGECVAEPRDCSAKDILGVSTCDSNPENNLLTFDFREAFTSTCNEEQDLCTEGSELITSTCDKERCGAECETNADCINRCEENIFYSSGLCLEGCTCSYALQDCDLSDDWYTTSLTRWIDIDQCNEKEQQDQEYREYSCSLTGCEYIITSNRWIDTGNVRNKPDFTVCDDGLWCTVDDSCQMGECVAQPRDCSANDILGVSTCDSNPDNNLLSFDFREAFTSTCNEAADLCTTGSELISSACDKELCGAECEADADCAATDCSHLNGCYNHRLFSCQDIFNACESTCACEQNSCEFEQQCGRVGTDSDKDGWDKECGDCDDTSAAVYPGAPEIIWNDIDEDCDGEDFIPCKIITPEAKSYSTDFIPIKVECEMPPWQIRYSIDGMASKIFCWECENFEIPTRFHQGYNEITITAAYPEKTTHKQTVRFLVDSHEPFIRNILPMSGSSGGKFEIYYIEQNLEKVTMYYRSKGESSYKAYSREDCPSGSEKCFFQPEDISDYNGKDIEYYFVLKDLAGNTKTSPVYSVRVDTSKPVFIGFSATPLLSFTPVFKSVYFNIALNEQVRSLRYIDYSLPNPVESLLCSNCMLYKGNKYFSGGSHTISVIAEDYAGNINRKDNVQLIIS